MISIFPKYKTLNNIIIYKNNLYNNISYIKSLNPNKKIIAVIKSNAYGHGLKEIVHILNKNKDINIIAVDSLYEAYILKKEKIKKEILILGYTNPHNLKLKKLPFSFVVSDIEILKTLNKYQKGAKVHIEIDTGMNRLGLKFTDFPEFIDILKECKNIKIEGIMSHFSSADDPSANNFTQNQIDTFKKAVTYFNLEKFDFKYIHIAASAGALTINDNYFNTIRTGLSLYGINPLEKDDDSFLPILELRSQIIQIKNVQKGEFIGYGRTYETRNAMIIGILPVGYFDGLDRRLSNIGYVKIENNFCKIVGRISMNLTAIDISNISNIDIGTEVTIYSAISADYNSIKNVAKLIDTIPYTVLTGINSTLRREIV